MRVCCCPYCTHLMMFLAAARAHAAPCCPAQGTRPQQWQWCRSRTGQPANIANTMPCCPSDTKCTAQIAAVVSLQWFAGTLIRGMCDPATSLSHSNHTKAVLAIHA